MRVPRPSPALVIACAALAIALGGVGYAATVLPRNSVGPLQLRPNSVNSTKVLNGSLLRTDFRAGSIPRGVAGPPGPAGPAGPAGAAGPAGPAGPTNTGVSLAVKNINSTSDSNTSSTSSGNVASTTIDVPSGNTATLVANFSAESLCYGAIGTCSVKITVDGTEMNPNSGNDFAFDSTENNTKTSNAYDANSIVRYQASVNAGSHAIAVEYRVSNASIHFRLDDWALSVVAYKQ